MSKRQILIALIVIGACAAAYFLAPKITRPHRPLKPERPVGADLVPKAEVPPTRAERRRPKLVAPKEPEEFVTWAAGTPTFYLGAEAVEAAGRLGTEWAEKVVAAALAKDEDGEFDDEDLSSRALYVKALRGDADVLPALVALLKQADGEWEIDMWGARTLALLPGEESLSVLLPMINREDEDEEATWDAVYAAGTRDSALARDAIKALLDHSDEDFGTFAAGALLRYDDPDAKRLVAAHFADPEESDWDEEYLARGLGMPGSVTAVPYLVLLTRGEDRDEDLRMVVARSLGRTKVKEAIAPLRSLLADEDGDVRIVAAAALARDFHDATGAEILVEQIRTGEDLELSIEAAKALLELHREDDLNLWRQTFAREFPKEDGLILRLWAAYGLLRE